MLDFPDNDDDELSDYPFIDDKDFDEIMDDSESLFADDDFDHLDDDEDDEAFCEDCGAQLDLDGYCYNCDDEY